MEQLSLLDNSVRETEQRNYEVFGCCSYYRECSDARKCVMNIEGYEGCSYRQNLEKGMIFYGKNANGFDKTLYNKMIDSYTALSNENKVLLLSLISHFIDNGAPYITWLYSAGIDSLCSSKWFNASTANDILERFDFHYLKNQIKNSEPDLVLPKKKDDLLQYIKDNKVHCIYEKYVNKYRNLSIPPHMKQYYIELYYDYISEYKNDVVDMSFKAVQTEGLVLG